VFGRRSKELRGLESELQRNRPEPRDGFVDQVVDAISTPPVPRRQRQRLGLSLAFALTMLVIFGAFGGLGYAKSASTHTFKSTTDAFTSVVQGNPGKHNGSNQQGKSDEKSSSQGVQGQKSDSDEQGDDEDHGSKPSHDQYQEKVLICHHPPGNPGKPVTISVGSSAVPAHLAHHDGDHVGACTHDAPYFDYAIPPKGHGA
jgi:hypothetical protein